MVFRPRIYLSRECTHVMWCVREKAHGSVRSMYCDIGRETLCAMDDGFSVWNLLPTCGRVAWRPPPHPGPAVVALTNTIGIAVPSYGPGAARGPHARFKRTRQHTSLSLLQLSLTHCKGKPVEELANVHTRWTDLAVFAANSTVSNATKHCQ